MRIKEVGFGTLNQTYNIAMHTMKFYIVFSIGGFTFTYNQCQKGSLTSRTIYGIQGTAGTQVNYLGKAQLFLTRDQTEMSPRVPHNESPL